MKRLATFAAVIASGLAPLSAVRAQAAEPTNYKIPFSFNANGVQLESGRYAVTPERNGVSSISGYGGGIYIMNAPQMEGQKRARLVFHKMGNAYFLAELWNENGTGRKVPMSKREQEMARSEAQARSKTADIVLLAQR